MKSCCVKKGPARRSTTPKKIALGPVASTVCESRIIQLSSMKAVSVEREALRRSEKDT
jgi:hypothetical protein